MTKALAVIGVVAVLAIIIGVWAIRYYSAKPRGIVGAQERIQSAPSRIANYNHFFDLCAAIQAQEAGLDALNAQLPTAETTQDRARINANITGVTAQRQRSIADYNADARKDYTMGQFRDSDLPYQLPTSDYKKGARTSCGSD